VKLVCIESPFSGEVERNVMYADACMLDALLRRNESPFLGHLQYPRVLNDQLPAHRAAGIAAHCAWLRRADLVAVYEDYGITSGMDKAIVLARSLHIPIEKRLLGPDWLAWFLAEAKATPGMLH